MHKMGRVLDQVQESPVSQRLEDLARLRPDPPPPISLEVDQLAPRAGAMGTKKILSKLLLWRPPLGHRDLQA